MTLLDDAQKKIKRDEKREKDQQAAAANLRIKTAADFKERLVSGILQLPVAYELICSFYGQTIATDDAAMAKQIVDLNQKVDEFEDVGHKGLDLVQTMDGEHNGEEFVVYYKAWAIWFRKVYDLNIYFVPYQNEVDGFAITVYYDDDHQKITFHHDIDRKTAVFWIAEYLKRTGRTRHVPYNYQKENE